MHFWRCLQTNNFGFMVARVKSLYPKCKTEYTLKECLEVFKLYYDAYWVHTGREHPLLRDEQVVKIIETMDTAETVRGYGETDNVSIPSEVYGDLIEFHFNTDYGESCDYNINHFFSGLIRGYRLYDGKMI